MDRKFEEKFKYYENFLKKDYVYSRKYGGKERYQINHIKFIIELLDGNPSKLWGRDFPYEVEMYEREKVREFVRRRVPSQIRKRVKELRKNPGIVEKLCKNMVKRKKIIF